MKTKQAALFVSAAATFSFVAFAFCVAFGITGSSISLQRAASVQTVSFPEAEVPVYRGYRPTSVTQVTFQEEEVPTIVISPKVSPKAYASR